MNNNFEFLDVLTILSFVVAIQNLELNTKQANRLEEHLNQQDTELLLKIIKQNEEIIELLKRKDK